MQELSLNVLDVAQNSISAGASLIEISVAESTAEHSMTVMIKDNGCGMTQEQVRNVTDPFYTTRTTRKVGLGVPLFKMACEMTGGSFTIDSAVGEGTTVKAEFRTDSIDCLPLGDMEETVYALVTLNCGIDFVYSDTIDGRTFLLDTREFREILGEVPFNQPDVAEFIRDYLKENSVRTNNT